MPSDDFSERRMRMYGDQPTVRRWSWLTASDWLYRLVAAMDRLAPLRRVADHINTRYQRACWGPHAIPTNTRRTDDAND
jgi:hypothetical protein